MPRARRSSPKLAPTLKRSGRKRRRRSNENAPKSSDPLDAMQRGWPLSIVRRLLQDAPAASVQDRLLDLVCEDVKSLPADSKQHIAERVAANERTPEVVTALALDKRTAERFGERLSAALGAPAMPVFRVDPALIAGVEVRFPFTILRRSWSEDLKRIEAELKNDDGAAKVA